MTADVLSLSPLADVAPPQCAKAARLVRVLFVINGEDYSGAERVQDLLALRLPDFGYEVGFACVLPDRFPAACQAQHVPLYRLPMRSRTDLRPIAALARLARREDYSLIHGHSHRATMIARPAAALARLPLVHHMHLQTVTDGSTRWRRMLYAGVERVSVVGASAVIAVSDSMRGYARSIGVADRRIAVVRNGVPTPSLKPRTTHADGPFVVGTVAMFRPRKGLEVLLAAIAQLRAQGLPVRLRAVGRFQFADHEAEVRRLVTELQLSDAIDWTGFTGDVGAELAQMDTFVLPSLLAEGMPMSVLEAMAAGVPVVGSDVDGIRDLVRHEQDGLLCAPGDAMALAGALARIVRGSVDGRSLATSARRRQIDEFSDRSMARGVSEVYNRVLAGRVRS